MWPNWKARQTELMDLARYFEVAEYPNTAEWLRHLAEQVEKREPEADLGKTVNEVLPVW